MNIDLRSINKEKIIKNKVMIIAVAAGLLALNYGYNEVYSKTTKAIAAIRLQMGDETLKLDVFQRLSLLQGEIDVYKKYFSGAKDNLWLVDKVSIAVKDAGLEVISLNPKPLVTLKDFLYFKIDVSARGSFHQLGDFVSLIESSGEFMRIETLSFKKDKEFMNADIGVASYLWKAKN